MKKFTKTLTLTSQVAFLAVAAIGGTALISTSVFAALTASTSNTSGGSVTTGTLKLTQASSATVGITGGFTTAITSMAPGDVVNRYIVLTNGGTLDGAVLTLATTATPGNTLTTDGTNGLQVTIRECSVAWSAVGGCSGTTTVALASTSLLAMGVAKTLTMTSLAASATNQLQFSISLPAGSENTVNGALPIGTVQGLTTAVTWNFLETLRTNTTSNS